MAKEIVIDCKANGTVESMHFDEFDLKFLGRKSVKRASEIMHNPETDLWDIEIPESGVHPQSSRGFTGYDIARRFEVEWLQACRKAGCSPLSDLGRVIADRLREDFDGGIS